jgi:hypothetical protein
MKGRQLTHRDTALDELAPRPVAIDQDRHQDRTPFGLCEHGREGRRHTVKKSKK